MTELSGKGFPAELRLKTRGEFSTVFDRGKVAADNVLVIHAVRSQLATTRLGLSISKKVGNAPVRNRWKRLIRESFRIQRRELPGYLWMVVRPRRGASPSLPAIESSLRRLSRQLDRKV